MHFGRIITVIGADKGAAPLAAPQRGYNYGHALEILHESFSDEWRELQDCLRKLRLTVADITKAGGNESPIPKKFDEVLYPYGWREIRISGDLIVKKYPRQAVQRKGRFSNEPYEIETIEGYIDGHNIDYLKNRVVLFRRNSKVAFDRDLLAMRTYFDCGLIDVGVIVTRAEELNDIFKEVTDDKGAVLMKTGQYNGWSSIPHSRRNLPNTSSRARWLRRQFKSYQFTICKEKIYTARQSKTRKGPEQNLTYETL